MVHFTRPHHFLLAPVAAMCLSRIVSEIFNIDNVVCPSVCLMVRSYAKTVRFTSRKDKNVPQWFLNCRITFLTLKGQPSRSRTQKCPNRFWPYFCAADSPIHSVNNRPVKRLTLVARLPPAFYIVPHAGCSYGIVTPFL